MATSFEIIGVHKVRAREPVHLVEGVIHGSTERLNLRDVNQEWPGKDESNWQVGYDEKVLTGDGTDILFDPWFPDGDVSQHWIGDVRIAFFFHYLNFDLPLKTPFGDVPIPPATRRPKRLRFMQYEPP